MDNVVAYFVKYYYIWTTKLSTLKRIFLALANDSIPDTNARYLTLSKLIND